MKSIFYFTISYSSDVEQELYFRVFQERHIDEIFSLVVGFWRISFFQRNDIVWMKYTPAVEEMNKKKLTKKNKGLGLGLKKAFW